MASSVKVLEPKEHEAPIRKTKSVPTRTFNAFKIPDLSGREASNKQLGLAGELFVMELEKEKLIKKGLLKLAKRVDRLIYLIYPTLNVLR